MLREPGSRPRQKIGGPAGHRSDLLEGTGPGSFGLWWARHAPFYSYVRNAHSLYFETLGETGLVGLAFADFALQWQPVSATFPARTALAYAFAILLVLGGAAVNWPRSAAFRPEHCLRSC